MTAPLRKNAVWKTSAVILGFAGLTAIGVGLLGPIASWLASAGSLGHLSPAQKIQAMDDARSRLLQLAGGIVAVGALFYNARNHIVSRRTYELTERGQMTERYTKAIEQLASEKMHVRLGAIYALERIAHDSPPDHQMVIDVLCAFVRGYSLFRGGGSDLSEGHQSAPDLQAAMQVIGRREATRDRVPLDLRHAKLAGLELYDADLSSCFMPGADLSSCSFHRVNLQNAKIMRIDWTDAHLIDVDMSHSVVAGAGFRKAHMERVNLEASDISDCSDFHGAFLLDVRLTGANLESANIGEAELIDVDFSGVDLSATDLAGMDTSAALHPRPGRRIDGEI